MLEFINKNLLGVAVPVLLMAVGIYYTVLLGAFHILKPKKVLSVLFKRNSSEGTSPFQAVTLALAGTLGVGNIVGVSAAIALGGFGSIFWMWISALCAMILKYAEILLAVKHRRFDSDGQPHGSAMHYITDYFRSISLKRIGTFIASVFAVLCVVNSLTMGSMIQSNAVSDALEGVFHISPILCGALLCLVTALVTSRGVRGISRLTEILVPTMALGYIIISVYILFVKREKLIPSFKLIFDDAFNSGAALGGIGGFLSSRALRFGTMRGVISNEAGCGTAPTAHAASNTKSAVEQGFWGIFEVFADTILLCTMTALVVIVSYDSLKLKGSWIMLTIDAYSAVLGGFAGVFLALSVLAFGFATILCWAHYGMESVEYLSGRKSAITKRCFILVYCLSTLIGSIAASESVWQIADLAIGAMTLINLPVLCLMSKEVRDETRLYFLKR
ncbi:MAG: sodium:alanine symporter family protein [Ruminococcaceae bacterium]|nr:sodium:alanine symporter family protein [Oscillospiraceae bacterium]